MIFRKKEKYQFTGRKHSIRGILSFLIGCLVLIGFIVISVISGANEGNAGLYVGIIGLLLLALAIYGIVLGVKSCKEKDIYYQMPIIGVILNGIFTVVFVVLYVVGL